MKFDLAAPLIITVAPLGAELTPDDTPHLPFRAVDFASTAAACVAAGASIVHMHCRSETGANTHDPGRFAEITAAVRAQTNCIVQYSTGGAIGMSAAERAAPLALRPEMATLTCGSVNFGDDIFENSLPLIRDFAGRMRSLRVRPELEIFDMGHLTTAKRLAADGLIDTPAHCDFVLGVPGAMEATPDNLLRLLADLPSDWTWSVAGIGRAQMPLGMMAIALGGHVRTGLEDNIWYARGVRARNEELVARVRRLAEEAGRPIADVAQAREILRITTE